MIFPLKPEFLCRRTQVSVSHRNLPHWDRCGVAVFVTIRLADSLPAERIRTLKREREQWTALHPKPWDEEVQGEYEDLFSERVDRWLDEGHGAAIFANPECRAFAERTIRYYADVHYQLYAYVVMSNHIHLLIMANDGKTVSDIIVAMKRYIARGLSKYKTWEGDFWQREYWDTFIRNEAHFSRVLAYIKGNDPSLAYSAFG